MSRFPLCNWIRMRVTADIRCGNYSIISIMLNNNNRIMVFVHARFAALVTTEGNTRYTQKNSAVSKVNKKFISHVTRAQRTPSAVATVQVSHVLITILQSVHPGSHDTHPHNMCTLGHTTHIHTVITFIPHSV
jgi:hypothetical protein